MAGLTESSTWETQIYQIETTDPVVGGADGISNLQAKQLGNRTQYLKAQAETHAASDDPHPQYMTQAETDARYDKLNAATTAITGHLAATDPHTAYLNPARGDARYAQKDHGHAGVYEPAGAVAAHAAATDPHPQYLTQTEADVRYQQLVADGGLAAHIAASDPHPQYLLRTDAATITGKLTSTTDTLTQHLSGADHFASGTRLMFPMAAAPTGWSQITTDLADNRMLRVVTGAGAGSGGSHSPILNNVVPSHTHGFTTGNQSADHTHSGWTGGISASHQHTFTLPRVTNQGSNFSSDGNEFADGGPGVHTGTTGTQSNDHTHYFSTGGVSAGHTHSGSTDNGSSQTNWTPRYIDLILCERQ